MVSLASCHPERPISALGLCHSCYVKKRLESADYPRAKCHPDEPHVAKGLCRTCYALQRNRDAGIVAWPIVMATCHPLRRAKALGLCEPCYLRSSRVVSPSHLAKYGLTPETYEAILLEQNSACAICGKPETMVDPRYGTKHRLSVDHNHTTGVRRGLLCKRCNSALGLLDDSIELVHRAKEYLERYME